VLIAAKADIAVAERYGCTALHWAAIEGHASICRVLLDEGVLLAPLNGYGKTPLEEAITHRHAECEAILAEATVAALPRGFRFAVTKAVDEQAPPGLDKQIFEAARYGKLDELLGICRDWAGHAVIDAYTETEFYNVSQNSRS